LTDHSSLPVIRERLPYTVHASVFEWVFACLVAFNALSEAFQTVHSAANHVLRHFRIQFRTWQFQFQNLSITARKAMFSTGCQTYTRSLILVLSLLETLCIKASTALQPFGTKRMPEVMALVSPLTSRRRPCNPARRFRLGPSVLPSIPLVPQLTGSPLALSRGVPNASVRERHQMLLRDARESQQR
jgi:hypothetical protein